MLLELEPAGILAFWNSEAYGISEILQTAFPCWVAHAIMFEIGISKRGNFFSKKQVLKSLK